MEAQPSGRVVVCPRCGQPISYIEKHRRNGHVYYYAVHYLGYERAPDGRVVKRLRKCYLDPDIYSYVSSTHGTSASLSGASLRGEEARVPGGPAGPRALSAFLYKFTCKI